MIGLEQNVVRLVPYTAEWQDLFEQERARIQAALGEVALDVQHVGSTAIPGALAKPILDIAVAVESFEGAAAGVEPMERIGYEYHGENGIPRRHYFVRRDPTTTHHVHVNERGSRAWEDQVLFRDYMAAHPGAVEAYNALKLELAARYPRDREAYTDGKAPFVERILLTARIVERATRLGASLAGVAGAADLRGSPSHRGGGEIDWLADGQSVLVLALAHAEDEPRLDWWDEGGSPGNRRLQEIAKELVPRLGEELGVEARPLPYRPGVFLKDAAVLAGLGVVGANNLLVTPRFGPRVRLRGLLLETGLASSGPAPFSPCERCGRPCQRRCPRQAFEPGAYTRERCQRQMEEDESNPVAGRDEGGAAVSTVRYCRACELACVAGRT